MTRQPYVWIALIALLLCSSCEKMVIDEQTTSSSADEKNANIVLSINDASFHPYQTSTRAVVDITTYCTRLNFVLYQNGEKVKTIEQSKDDDGYGQVALALEPGTYQLLVLAHSCKTNPTLSHIEEIKFNNKETGYSDTFYYYGELQVTDEPRVQNHSIRLTRATTLVRLEMNDYPQDLHYITVYYTGGSGVFNAVTGYGGSVNSQQEVSYRVVNYVENNVPFVFPVYTFLQQDTGSMFLRITACRENGEVIMQREYSDVPVERGKMTIFTGYFFDPQNNFSMTAETDWDTAATLTY